MRRRSVAGIAAVVAATLFMAASGRPGTCRRSYFLEGQAVFPEPVRLELKGFFPGSELEKDDVYLSNGWSMAKDDTGDILVLDSQAKTVFEFGPDGRFIRKFGRAGQGPGEFSSPAGIACFGSFRYIKDFPRIQVFDRTGQYARTLTTRTSYFDLAFGPEGTLYASRHMRKEIGKLVDALEKEGHVLFSFGEPEERGNIHPGFLNQVRLATDDRGEIILAFQTLGIVRVYDKKGIKLRDVPLESRGVESERAYNMRQFAKIAAGEQVGYHHVIEAVRCAGGLTYVMRKIDGGLEIMTFNRDDRAGAVFRYEADKEFYGVDFEVGEDPANPVFSVLEGMPENRVDILVPAIDSRD
jgi:hypothetical protein